MTHQNESLIFEHITENVIELYLSFNNMSFIGIESVFGLKKLEVLDLDHNKLVDPSFQVQFSVFLLSVTSTLIKCR